MNELTFIILSVFGGFLLGLFFFAGLWWTIKKSIVSKHAALLMLSSMTIRVCVVLSAFYYISLGSWKRILGCLAGFVLSKIIVNRWTKRESEKGTKNSGEPYNVYKS